MTQTGELTEKWCSRCTCGKPISTFSVKKNGRRSSWCRPCVAEDSRLRHAAKIKAGVPRVYALNEAQKARAAQYQAAWVKANPERRKIIKERHESKNKERIKELSRARSLRRYYKKTADPQKYARDLLAIRLRNRFYRFVNGGVAGKRLGEIINYSVDELKNHLQVQFLPGMSWADRSLWHIDHIRPLSSFDDPMDPEAWALPNLRPVWAKENLRKSWKLQFLL